MGMIGESLRRSPEEASPCGVADMDFAAPDCVQSRGLRDMTGHGVYGYFGGRMTGAYKEGGVRWWQAEAPPLGRSEGTRRDRFTDQRAAGQAAPRFASNAFDAARRMAWGHVQRRSRPRSSSA